jgi:hypothetical protein
MKRKTNTPRRCYSACLDLARAYRHGRHSEDGEASILHKERKVSGYRLAMQKIFGNKGRFAFKKISSRACRDALKVGT